MNVINNFKEGFCLLNRYSPKFFFNINSRGAVLRPGSNPNTRRFESFPYKGLSKI